MFYVIPNTFLKGLLNTNKTGHYVLRYTWHIVEMSLNTNKTGHHVIHYTWHIFESVVKNQ
jgi:hypothetical protein